MDKNNLLQQLKDIHNPPPVSWWPLAPGWYIVIAILVIGLILLTLWWLRRRQQRKKHQYIIQQFTLIKAQAQQQDPTTVSSLSTFLRRLVLLKFPREEVAGLSGEQWLLFLDRTMETNQFSQGPGRLLVTIAYQQRWDQQTDELINLIEEWMKQCLK